MVGCAVIWPGTGYVLDLALVNQHLPCSGSSHRMVHLAQDTSKAGGGIAQGSFAIGAVGAQFIAPLYPSRKSLLKGRTELYLRAGKDWPFDWGNYIDCSL